MPHKTKDLSVFAKRLKEIRKVYGTQEQFSQRVGIVPSTYRGYESGNRVPDLKILKSICKATGVSADWLIGLDDFGTQPAKSVIMNEAISLTKNDTQVYTDVHNGFPTIHSVT